MKKSIIAIAVAGTVAIAYGVAQNQVNEQVRTLLDEQVKVMSEDTGLTFNYSNVNTNLLNQDVNISEITVSNENKDELLTIDNIKLIGYEPETISDFTEVTINGLTFSQATRDQIKDFPKKLLESTYNINTSLAYNADSGDSKLKSTFAAESLVSIKFDLDIGNSKSLMDTSLEVQKMQKSGALTLEQELQIQSKMMGVLQEIHPQSFSFSIHNKGELKEFLTEQLTNSGVDQAALESMVDMQLANLPLTEEAKSAVLGFVKGQQALDVSAEFPEKLNVMQISQQLGALLGQPDKLAQALNLQIKGR
jgi:hypothetical protein